MYKTTVSGGAVLISGQGFKNASHSWRGLILLNPPRIASEKKNSSLLPYFFFRSVQYVEGTYEITTFSSDEFRRRPSGVNISIASKKKKYGSQKDFSTITTSPRAIKL